MRLPLLCVLLAGCPSAPDSEPTPDPTPAPVVSDQSLADYAGAGDLAVGVRTLQLEDLSRPTAANGDDPERASRLLTVELWYPATVAGRDAPPLPGDQPLLLWSHGFTSSRLDSPRLAAHLASNGYVVAAPDFPLTSRTTAEEPDSADVVNQPGDLRFILDALLDDPDFATERIAAGGISLGGLTTLLIGLDPDYADPRVDALLPLAAFTCPLRSDSLATPVPLLLVHGDSDAILPFEAHARPFFDASSGPRRLVTLLGGTHTGFADITEDLLDGADHADSLGCGQVLAALDGDDPPPQDPDALNPQCPAPCEDLEALGIGMRPSLQGLLTRGIAHAFLDSALQNDAEAGLWLDTGLGPQQGDVTVEVGE